MRSMEPASAADNPAAEPDPRSVQDPVLLAAAIGELATLCSAAAFVRLPDGTRLPLGPSGAAAAGRTEPEVHPDDRDAYLAALGSDAYRVAYRAADGLGRWRDLEEAGRTVRIGGSECRVGAVCDVTGRREAERARARYLAIVEAQAEWIVRQSPDGHNTFVNEAYCRWKGMSREALTAPDYPHLGRVEDASRDRFLANRATLGPDRPWVTTELEILHHDGTRRWQVWTDMAILGEAGEIVEYQSVGREITEEKRMELALRASEAELRAIIDTQTEWVTRQTLDGRFTFVNAAYCRYMGMTAAQLLDPAWDDYAWIPPDEKAAFFAARAARTPADPTFTMELTARHPDGSTHLEEWTETAVFDAEGRTISFQAVGWDITAQRRAEAASRESEDRFRRFAEAHPVPLCALRADDWRVLFVNPAYLDLFQLTWEELDGADKRTQWADPEKRAPYYERLRREGRTDNCEVVLRRKDGSTFPALLSSRLMQFAGGEAVVNSVVDLSRLRAAEAEIERQREALHQSEKLAALGSLLAGVAHELNNPLSVVIGYASVMRAQARGKRIREQAEQIHAAAERCARIVKSFLGMAREKPPVFGPVDVAATVEGALELAAYALRTSGVKVLKDLPAGLPAVHGDADQIHQVVANLVLNAVQALQDRPQPRRISIVAGAADGRIRLVIADNGPGMSPEVLRRAFEPFYTTKSVGVGTGLGLAVCHGIVTAHGGEIAIDSTVGRGTRVELQLPAAGAAAAMAPAEPPPAVGAGTAAEPPARRGRILVVDDEPEIAALVAAALAAQGHAVEPFTDGAAAIERARRGGLDLVVSDLRMPGKDGVAILRELKRHAPALARTALVLTGDVLSAGRHPELKRGSVMLVEKPVDLDELCRLVAARLEQAAP